MSARETARLMGLPEDYLLPATYSDAYHLTGDGVVVPVVRHIAGQSVRAVAEDAHRAGGGLSPLPVPPPLRGRGNHPDQRCRANPNLYDGRSLLPLPQAKRRGGGLGEGGLRVSAKETRDQRSAIMRAVKGRDTAPEIAVRTMLRRFAPGYRLHRKDVPGTPDIAFIGRKRRSSSMAASGTGMIARAARAALRPTPTIGAPRSPGTSPATRRIAKSSRRRAGARSPSGNAS